MIYSSEPGKVVTFYSYKGGTGRTMALANVACLLAQQRMGRGVLTIDWDLEAPGLHRFFAGRLALGSRSDEGEDKELDRRPGLIDLFEELNGMIGERQSSSAPLPEDEAIAIADDIDLEPYMVPTTISNVWMIKSGRRDELYSSRVTRFNWEDFYTRAPALIRGLAERLSREYSYILIDSRTGLTDASGICTMLMPDKLVVVFTPNRQSVEGALEIVKRATNYRSRSWDLRPLIVFPLPSRIEAAEPELRRDWRFGNTQKNVIGYQNLFELTLRECYKLDAFKLDAYFNEVGIQHVPSYAYGERIAALVETAPEQSTPDRFSMTRSYQTFVEWLVRPSGPWNPKDQPSLKTAPEVSAPAVPNVVTFRKLGAKSAVLFVHGFGGDPVATWGRLPGFLLDDERLGDWDLFSLRLDLQPRFSSTGSMAEQALALATAAALNPLDPYFKLAIVAHGEGGLVAQEALVGDPKLAARVSHLFLFATPSAGLRKASLFSYLLGVTFRNLVQDVYQESPFIRQLRSKWSHQFGHNAPFRVLTIAGERDEVVPSTSSLSPFRDAQRFVVPGNHSRLVKPNQPGDAVVQLIAKELTAQSEGTSISLFSEAQLAFEMRDYQKTVRLLAPAVEELSPPLLGTYAMALERTGRWDEAMALLASRGVSQESKLVLASMYLRRWLAEGRNGDATSALDLYEKILEQAQRNNDLNTASYAAIQIAFLQLAFLHDGGKAKSAAVTALEICERLPRDRWRLATEGNAHLILGDTDHAMDAYREALGLASAEWEIESIRAYALRIAAALADGELVQSLTALFTPPPGA